MHMSFSVFFIYCVRTQPTDGPKFNLCLVTMCHLHHRRCDNNVYINAKIILAQSARTEFVWKEAASFDTKSSTFSVHVCSIFFIV